MKGRVGLFFHRIYIVYDVAAAPPIVAPAYTAAAEKKEIVEREEI